MTMDFLRCVVQRITFSNEENGWTVLRVSARGFSELVTVVGSMGAVSVGSEKSAVHRDHAHEKGCSTCWVKKGCGDGG